MGNSIEKKQNISRNTAKIPQSVETQPAVVPTEELLNRLNSSSNGLSQIEAQNRLDEYGYNELAEMADSHGKPWYAKMEAEKGQFAPVAKGWYKSY